MQEGDKHWKYADSTFDFILNNIGGWHDIHSFVIRQNQKTHEDVERLKKQYPDGYIGDKFPIEDAEGFEYFKDELIEFRERKDAERNEQIRKDNLYLQKTKAGAFPEIYSEQGYEGDGLNGVYSRGGMTKREYFAARALQGYLSANPEYVTFNEIADCCVQAADALIEELAKEVKR